jgi:exosortase
MANQWAHDEDMGHAFAVVPAASVVVWRERRRLAAAAGAGDARGYALLAAGAGLHAAAAVGAGVFAGAVGMLVSAAGAVVALGGFRLLRALSFPFVLSLFLLPKLAIVYNQATLPLVLVASRLAAWGLEAAGVAVLRYGNVLEVNGHSVAVEAACSGIRYLLPLAFVALLYGYLGGGRRWGRVVLAVAAAPVAIAANALRVAVSVAWPELAAGPAHAAAGVTIFGLGVAALAGIHELVAKCGGRADA